MRIIGPADRVKAYPAEGIDLFRDHRVTRRGGVEVVHAVLHPWIEEKDPRLEALIHSWPGRAYVSPVAEPAPAGGYEVALVREMESAPGPRWFLSLSLFLLTLFTTLTAGALLRGVDPLGTRPLDALGGWIPVPTTVDWEGLLLGAPFSLTFLAILLGHEFGHYVAARRHGVQATLPYFIPVPAYFTVVGTLGAFIRLRSPIIRRSILLDIGVAGPIVSFALSVPALAIGLALSTPAPGPGDPFTPYVIHFAGQAIWLGDGVLVRALALLTTGSSVGGEALLLHPVAFAGWLGLFVTFLNLLPLGQLDGGHIAHAVLGERQRWLGTLFLILLLPMGLVWWGWWFWGLVALALGRGRASQPALVQGHVPPGRGRRLVGWAMVVIFLLCFPPVPVAV